MSLDAHRAKIDAIDVKLLELLNERAEIAHEIGSIKKTNGQEIYAPEREETLLRSLVEKNQGRLPAHSVRAIYREIMSASLALEKDLRIAYLGPEATWTHQAARQKFGASVHYSPQPSIPDVFLDVQRGHADYGVVPVENSTEGAVNHTLDVFMDSNLSICAQVLLKIEHNLIGKTTIDAVKRIFSHPQAFGQCREWLHQHLPHAEWIEVSSTTRAAELAAASPTDSAAVSGALAAEVYGLNILVKSIQDNPHNTTRFLVIGHKPSPPTGADRTSIMFAIKDEAGALFSALQPFHRLNISLSKIESRPSKQKAWEYFFFVDLEGHPQTPRVAEALTELQSHCTLVKILGSYPFT